MEICELRKEDEKAWDKYVLKHPNSTFFHQIGWKTVVEKTYGHKQCYIIAKERDEIIGVLPLFLMESRIFGTKLISVPFAPYGGVLADDEPIKISLFEEAKRISKQYNCDYFELRNLDELKDSESVTNLTYNTFIIRLDEGLEKVLGKLRRDKKKGIKKAQKANLTMEWGTNIDNFYMVYAQNMKDLGTPVHSNDFFKNIMTIFTESRVLTIKHKDIAICCKFLLFYKDTVISMWGTTLKEYQEFHPYDLANWETLEYSFKNGYKVFDFGRCLVNSGVFQYKEGWSNDQRQLYYQSFLGKAKNPTNLSQSNPTRQRFATVWSKIPLPMTKIIGPFLRKNYP